MLRCTQMLLAQAIRTSTNCSPQQALAYFVDSPAAPFSIQTLSHCGAELFSMPVGSWYGPAKAMHVARSAALRLPRPAEPPHSPPVCAPQSDSRAAAHQIPLHPCRHGRPHCRGGSREAVDGLLRAIRSVLCVRSSVGRRHRHRCCCGSPFCGGAQKGSCAPPRSSSPARHAVHGRARAPVCAGRPLRPRNGMVGFAHETAARCSSASSTSRRAVYSAADRAAPFSLPVSRATTCSFSIRMLCSERVRRSPRTWLCVHGTDNTVPRLTYAHARSRHSSAANLSGCRLPN
jgi:hypothetical protein